MIYYLINYNDFGGGLSLLFLEEEYVIKIVLGSTRQI